MKNIKVGYISLARTSFDMELSEGYRSKALTLLKEINKINIIDPGQLITSETEVGKATEMFKDKQIDLLLVHFCSFTLGTLTPYLAVNLNVPILLLSSPEADFKDNRLHSNSFCALNHNCNTLYNLKKKHRYIFKSLDDDSIKQDFEVVFTAIQTVKSLKNTRVGLIGSRAPGFYISNFNELKLLNELGVVVEHIDISKVYREAEKVNEKEVIAEGDNLLKSIGNRTKVTSHHLHNTIRAYTSFSNLAKEFRLDALAVKCWPEFHTDYGTAPYSAIGMMSSKMPTAMEGDMYGVVTMMMQRNITGELQFLADLIYTDIEKNTGIFWHPGCAPMELAGDKSEITLDNFSLKVKGAPDKGCEMNFQIFSNKKRATVNRIGTDCDGNFRILDITGQNIKSDIEIRGNTCHVKFDNSVESIRKGILDNGFEHHYSLVLEDISSVVEEIAFWKDFKLIRL